MSELEQEINKTRDLKQALGILLAGTTSSSATIKVKKNSVTGTIKVAEECVLAVGMEGAEPNTTASDLLLELLSLEDALIEYQDIDEAFYPEGLTSTNMPIPMLLASNFSQKTEKPKQQTDGKARNTGEFLKVFGDGAALEALDENRLILSEEELQEDEPEPIRKEESDITEPVGEKKEESDITEPVGEKKEESDITTEPVGEKKEESDIAEPVGEKKEESDITEPVGEKKEESDITEPVGEKKEESDIAEPVEEKKEESGITEPVDEKKEEADITEPAGEKEESDAPESVDEKKERFELLVAQREHQIARVQSEHHNQLVDGVSYELRPGLESNEVGFPDDFEKLRKSESDNSDLIYYIPEAEKAENKELTESEHEALLEAQARAQRKSLEVSTSHLKASIHKSQVEEGEAQYQKSRQILIRGLIVAGMFGVMVLPLLPHLDSSRPAKPDSASTLARLAIERANSETSSATPSDTRSKTSIDTSSKIPTDTSSKTSSGPTQTGKESYSSGSNEAPFQLPQGSSNSGPPPSGSGSSYSASKPQPSAPLGFAYQKLHLSRAISKGKNLGVDTSGYSAALKNIEQDRHAKKHQPELVDKMKALSKELDANIAAREPAKEQAFVGMGIGLPGNMPPEGSAERELYMSTKISSSTPLVVKGLHDSLQKSSSLKTGDRILAIDGVSVDGLSIYEIQNKLTGTTGTEVKITYESADNSVSTVKLICNSKNKL